MITGTKTAISILNNWSSTDKCVVRDDYPVCFVYFMFVRVQRQTPIGSCSTKPHCTVSTNYPNRRLLNDASKTVWLWGFGSMWFCSRVIVYARWRSKKKDVCKVRVLEFKTFWCRPLGSFDSSSACICPAEVPLSKTLKSWVIPVLPCSWTWPLIFLFGGLRNKIN